MAPSPDSPPHTLEELLKKNPELSRTDLEYLQDWMSKQPHLPKLTDLELVPFLHSNFYSLEKAKKTIENYYTIRTHAPAMFQNRDPHDPEVKKQLDVVNFGRLSKKDARGYKMIGTKWFNSDPTQFEFETMIKSFLMILEQEVREDPTCPGFVMVMDNRGTSMGHIAKSGVAAIKVFLAYLQDAVPCRMREFHILYCTPIVETILRIAKPFMKAELLDVLYMHSGDMDELYKKFPRDLLPKEFDGTLDNMQDVHATSRRKLEANRSWFLEQDKLLVDESKRPGKAKSAGEVFGLEGSFKKLDID